MRLEIEIRGLIYEEQTRIQRERLGFQIDRRKNNSAF